MGSATYDQLRTLYRTLLVFATVGTIVLAVGLIQFVYLEPPGQTSGVKAHIVGVYRYNPETKQVIDGDRSEFARSDELAAVVDWTSVPPNTTVDARWYDSFGSLRGEAGPARAATLTADSVIPVQVPEGFRFVLPGRYTFVVERISDGVPVEVLGRRFVVVDRT